MRIAYLKTILVAAVLLLPVPAAMAIFLGDGEVHNIDYAEPHLAVDFQLPGLQTTANILETGHVEFLEAFEDSIVNLLGGSLGNVVCFDNSHLRTYAGEVLFVDALGDSLVDIFGGSAQAFGAAENGTATIHGSNFAVNGDPVGYVELSTIIGLGTTAHLTGTLSNGDPLDAVCDIYGNGRIFLVPEPATVLLIALAALALRTRPRKLK